jgi:hypothetical protein
MSEIEMVETMLVAAESQAKEVIILRQQQLPPTWILVNAENEINIEATPWNDDLGKVLAKVYIKKRMIELKIIAYSFMSECWVANAPKGWQLEQPLFTRPSKNPTRWEAVIAFASDGKNKDWRFWNIKRNKSNVAIALERLDEGIEDMEGWMDNML